MLAARRVSIAAGGLHFNKRLFSAKPDVEHSNAGILGKLAILASVRRRNASGCQDAMRPSRQSRAEKRGHLGKNNCGNLLVEPL
jgi:hypothetical protein